MCRPVQKASAKSRRVIRKSLPASGELNPHLKTIQRFNAAKAFVILEQRTFG
jgi:hypothetical protein